LAEPSASLDSEKCGGADAANSFAAQVSYIVGQENQFQGMTVIKDKYINEY
jgi:hypothetical protein